VRDGVPVKIRAFRPGLGHSEVVSSVFAFKVGTPWFTPAPGPITNGTVVSIETTTAGAIIYYTLDNITPTANSPVYSGPLTLEGNTTLKARAVYAGFADSDVRPGFYGLAAVAMPTFSPSSAVITNSVVTVEISCATPGAEIRYTVDGSAPGPGSPLYSSPFSVSGNTTLNAQAFATNYGPSAVASQFYPFRDYENVTIVTVAGDGSPGFQDGLGRLAQFNHPDGICVDPAGNLFVADRYNHRIRKIGTNGIVSTLAGTGAAAFQDGPGASAMFAYPVGICLDPAGNLYVADRGNDRIRFIDLSNNVTKFAGNGNHAEVDGDRLNASFRNLAHLELDSLGNLFMGDWAKIRRVSPDGMVSHVAGTGVYCCGWSGDVGVGLDALGNVFAGVAGAIRQVDLLGGDTVFAGGVGGHADGPRLQARFSGDYYLNQPIPRDIAGDQWGNLFVVDQDKIRRVGTNGNVSTLVPLTKFAATGSSLIAFASGLCVDKFGNIFVTDIGRNTILRISLDSDLDEIPDYLEGGSSPYVLGADDRLVDSDQDGMSNTAEFLAGTNPLDAESFLAITALTIQTNTLPEIQWRSVAGKSYVIKYSDDLAAWIQLGSPVIATNSTTSVTDPTAVGANPRRVYRIFLLGD